MAPKRKAPAKPKALNKKVATGGKQQQEGQQHQGSHQESQQQASMVSPPPVSSPQSPSPSVTCGFPNNGASNATPGNTKQTLFQQVVRRNANSNANTTEALRNSAGLMATMVQAQNDASFDSFLDPALDSHDQTFMGGESSLDDFMANLSDPAGLNIASSSSAMAPVQAGQNMMGVYTQTPQVQAQYLQQQSLRGIQFQPSPNSSSGFGLGLQIPVQSMVAHLQHTGSLSGPSNTHSPGFAQLNSFHLPQDMTDMTQYSQPAQMANFNFAQDMPSFDQSSQTSHMGSFNGSYNFAQDISNSAQPSQIAQTARFNTSQSAVGSIQSTTPTQMGSFNFHPAIPTGGYNQSFLTPDQILAMRRTRATSFTFPQTIPQLGTPVLGSSQGVVNTGGMSNDFMSSDMIAKGPLNVDYNNLDLMNFEFLNANTINNLGMNAGGMVTGNLSTGGMSAGGTNTSGMIANATIGLNTGIPNNGTMNPGDMNTAQMNFGGQNTINTPPSRMQSNARNTAGPKLNVSESTSGGVTIDGARNFDGNNAGGSYSGGANAGDVASSSGGQPGVAIPESIAAFQQNIQNMTPAQRQDRIMNLYLMDFKKQSAFLGRIQPPYRTVFQRGVNYIQQWCSFEKQRRDLIASVNQGGLQQPVPSKEQQAQLRALMEHLRLLENDFWPTDPVQAQRQLRNLFNLKHGQPAPSNQQRQSQQRARTPSMGSGSQNPHMSIHSPQLQQAGMNMQAMSPPKPPNLIQSGRTPSRASVSQHPQNNTPYALGGMGTQATTAQVGSTLGPHSRTLSSGSAASPPNATVAMMNPRTRKDSYSRQEVEIMLTQAVLWGQQKEREQNMAQGQPVSHETADDKSAPVIAEIKRKVDEKSRQEKLEQQESAGPLLAQQTRVFDPNATTPTGHPRTAYPKGEASGRLTVSPGQPQNTSPQPVNRRAATQEKVIQKAVADGLAEQGLAPSSRGQSLTPNKSQASPRTPNSRGIAEAQGQLATPRQGQGMLQPPQLGSSGKILNGLDNGSLNNHEIVAKMQQDLNDAKRARQAFDAHQAKEARQAYDMNMFQQYQLDSDQLKHWEQAVRQQPIPSLSNAQLAGLQSTQSPTNTGSNGSIAQQSQGQVAFVPQTGNTTPPTPTPKMKSRGNGQGAQQMANNSHAGPALSSKPAPSQGKVQLSSKDSETEPDKTPKNESAAHSLKLGRKIPQKTPRKEHIGVGPSNSNDENADNDNEEIKDSQQEAMAQNSRQEGNPRQVQVNMNTSQPKVAGGAADNDMAHSVENNQQTSNPVNSRPVPRGRGRPQKNNLSDSATPEPTPRALPKTQLKGGNSATAPTSGPPLLVTEEERLAFQAAIKETDKRNPLLNGGELKTPSRLLNRVGSSPPTAPAHGGQDRNENNEVLDLPPLPLASTYKTPIKVLNKLGSSLGDTPDSARPTMRAEASDAAMALPPKNISRGFKPNPGRATTSGPVKREWRELPDDAESSPRPAKRRPPPPLELTNTNLGDFEAYSAATKYPRIRTPRDWQDAVARSHEVDAAVAMSDDLLSGGLFTSGDRDDPMPWLTRDYENHEFLEIIGPIETPQFVSLSDLYNPSPMEQILHRNFSEAGGLEPLPNDPVVQTKKVRNISKLSEWQVGDHIKVHGDSPDDDDLRRKKLVSSLLKSASEENEKLEKQSAVPPYFRPAPERDQLKLAVSQIKKGYQYDPYVDSHLQILCSFCCYDGDYGVVDESVRMDEEAFMGYCADCYVSSRGFDNELMTGQYRFRQDSSDPSKASISERFLNNQPVPLKETMDNLEIRKKALSVCQAFKMQGKGPFFASDGKNVTCFMPSLTCRSSPYGQVDVNRAYICDSCRKEKLDIIGHRHVEFQPISEEGLLELEDFAGDVTLVWEPKARRCMICVSSAAFVCTECPLRLCERCKEVLEKDCKRWLDNLFYHYSRAHLRNDAFLLRADGGGF
ncbi:hypothetical protein B0J14DRAFT_641441 [Halenospora varia]|nr:hypothetical protein B0J14DRAFT_641441 [Halenospora varia]